MRPVLGASGRRGRRARVPAAAASPRRAASACKGRPFDASEFLTNFFSSLTVCVLQLSQIELQSTLTTTKIKITQTQLTLIWQFVDYSFKMFKGLNLLK